MTASATAVPCDAFLVVIASRTSMLVNSAYVCVASYPGYLVCEARFPSSL